MDDLISRKAAIDTLWKALYEYEDKTEKQFVDSEELNIDDWFQHRIFVQNMNDIDRQTILNLPSAQPEINKEELKRTIRAGIVATNTKDVYSCGMRNGMRWCKALLEDDVPKFEDASLYAQPEQRWIPVSERLPEPEDGYMEDEYVLISKKPTMLSGSKWCVTIAIRMADPRSGKIQWRDSGFGVIQDDEVLAWMPRPKPYRGGKQDEGVSK